MKWMTLINEYARLLAEEIKVTKLDRMAHRIATQSDTRWSRLSLLWDPVLYFDGMRGNAHRSQSRPKKRWIDDVLKFLASISANTDNWMALASNTKYWRELEEQFASDCWRQGQHIPRDQYHFSPWSVSSDISSRPSSGPHPSTRDLNPPSESTLQPSRPPTPTNHPPPRRCIFLFLSVCNQPTRFSCQSSWRFRCL